LGLSAASSVIPEDPSLPGLIDRICPSAAVIAPHVFASVLRAFPKLNAIMAGRRDPSTALPAPFLASLVPCWPFPCGDGSLDPSGPCTFSRYGKRRKDKTMTNTERQDVYTRITGQIISSLEQGVRPWIQPWNAGYAGRITRPLRHNGQAYSGINILMLWASAAAQGFTAPVWMTFKQAMEAGAHVRMGEKGSLVVYANIITKTETEAEANEVEREIPFMKGYTVFNVEQIERLAGSLLHQARAQVLARRSYRARGPLLRQHRSHDSLWRGASVLRDGARSYPDASHRSVP
jgi:hypothetical protein